MQAGLKWRPDCITLENISTPDTQAGCQHITCIWVWACITAHLYAPFWMCMHLHLLSAWLMALLLCWQYAEWRQGVGHHQAPWQMVCTLTQASSFLKWSLVGGTLWGVPCVDHLDRVIPPFLVHLNTCPNTRTLDSAIRRWRLERALRACPGSGRGSASGTTAQDVPGLAQACVLYFAPGNRTCMHTCACICNSPSPSDSGLHALTKAHAWFVLPWGSEWWDWYVARTFMFICIALL